MGEMRISDLRVGEAMSSDFGLVDQKTPVHQVVDLMLQNHWGETIVVDHNHSVIGLVTKEHLVRSINHGMPKEVPIAEICYKDIITTTHSEELVRARDIMRAHRIGRLPVLNGTGQVIGVLTARDVCNGFSSKLETLGEHLYAVIENIAEAIRVIDCDGIVSFWNHGAEKLYGIKAADILDRNLADFFPDDLLLKVVSSLNSHHNVLSELGNGHFVVHNAVPVVFASGEIVGAVCTSLDVSHAKNLMDKLERANIRVKNLERHLTRGEMESEKFYTQDPETTRVLRQAQRVAQTDATVLIEGESGTGKELMADVIYASSKRSGQPFVEINCSAIPESLFESEMFGYESGAFTGGHKSGKKGKFELAAGGTLFLDEIGELPLDMQAKLLRVLQERRFYPVGGTTPITADCRIIAATNRKLSQLVRETKFRQDLYYRLSVVVLKIPPLRERKGDIPGLMQRFLRKLAVEYQRGFDRIDDEVMQIFGAYNWPGNVRQLQNLLESVVILAEGHDLTVKSLREAGVCDVLTGERRFPNETVATDPVSRPPQTLEDMMLGQEKAVIVKALEACRYNKAEAAKMLGIPRSTLYYKLKSLGINRT